MLQIEDFKKWLKANTALSDAVVGDTASRMKRADALLQWNGEDTGSPPLPSQEERLGIVTAISTPCFKV